MEVKDLLLECPFCGASGIFCQNEDEDFFLPPFWISCEDEFCSLGVPGLFFGETAEEAVLKWNTRADINSESPIPGARRLVFL